MDFIERLAARCKDCYRCLRECPVKAIQVEKSADSQDMHVKIIDQRCILDGKCITVCPQKAKRPRSDVKLVASLIARGFQVVAQVAPSFPSVIPMENPLCFPTLLRKLGFSLVSEVAIGAELVAKAHANLFRENRGPYIVTACPAVVNLIEKHYPEAVPFLAPLVSPAIAHARYLKSVNRDYKVVFIGPCVAKKDEIERPDSAFATDVALTFDEVFSWAEKEGIDFASLEESDFDPPYPDEGRLFPAEGGLLRAARISQPVLSTKVAAVSGIENCIEVIKHLLSGYQDLTLVELMACPGGCISGPGAQSQLDLFTRRMRLLNYFEKSKNKMAGTAGAKDGAILDVNELLGKINLSRTYRKRKAENHVPSEEEIQKVLAMTGKYSKEDELNCNACGYGSCREKAVAVLRGYADPTMCLPYMRQRAESMANLVVQSIPSAIAVISKEGTLCDGNPQFLSLVGKPAKEILGLAFDQVFPKEVVSQIRSLEKGKVLRGSAQMAKGFFELTVFFEPTQAVKVVILTDKTEEHRQKEVFDTMRQETLDRVETVIKKQMEVAQKIAGLLGETTAETKGSLSQLVKTLRKEEKSERLG